MAIFDKNVSFCVKICSLRIVENGKELEKTVLRFDCNKYFCLYFMAIEVQNLQTFKFRAF